jgi:hypothetical protein
MTYDSRRDHIDRAHDEAYGRRGTENDALIGKVFKDTIAAAGRPVWPAPSPPDFIRDEEYEAKLAEAAARAAHVAPLPNEPSHDAAPLPPNRTVRWGGIAMVVAAIAAAAAASMAQNKAQDKPATGAKTEEKRSVRDGFR